MLSREPYETRFQGGTEIQGFNQIEKFLRHIILQNKLYCFSEEKKIRGVRCTLISCVKPWFHDCRKSPEFFLSSDGLVKKLEELEQNANIYKGKKAATCIS